MGPINLEKALTLVEDVLAPGPEQPLFNPGPSKLGRGKGESPLAPDFDRNINISILLRFKWPFFIEANLDGSGKIKNPDFSYWA